MNAATTTMTGPQIAMRQMLRELERTERQVAHTLTLADNLVKTLRDMANYANANPRESFPGVGDLDDVTDQAQELRDLLEGLA